MGLALPAESASLWNTIRREAVAVAAAEPALAAWLQETVVGQSNLRHAGTIELPWRSVAAATKRPLPGELPSGPIATIPFDRDRDPRSAGTA